MRTIPLADGRVAVVDDDDYERFAKHKWYTHDDYATRKSSRASPPRLTVRMHREVVGAGPGVIVDHINGDRLDNRKSNLRIASTFINARNRRLNSNNKSGAKGVRRSKQGRWVAEIKAENQTTYLGTFATVQEAADAYDAAAIVRHGEAASTNAMLRQGRHINASGAKESDSEKT